MTDLDTPMNADDRRNFLKKALAAGGVAASAPAIVTSIVSPAAAFSAGSFRVQYSRAGASGNYNSTVPPVAVVTCDLAFNTAWAGAAAPGGAINITRSGTGAAPVFTLNAPDLNCQFVAGRRADDNGSNCNAGTAGTLSNGNQTITFSGVPSNGRIYLVVTCT